MALAFLCAGGSVVSTAEGAAPRGPGSPPVPPSSATCPGPKKVDPKCPQPTDLQCADVRYYSDLTCIGNWTDHCACVNQTQLATAEMTSGAQDDRRPSHATTLQLSSGAPNVKRVKHYGIDTNLLTTKTAIPVRGAPLDIKINGVVTAKSVGPIVPIAKGGRAGSRVLSTSHPTHPPVSIPLSKHNTWTAHETLARGEASHICPNMAGTALVECAKKYLRPGITPGIGLQSPEDFVYKRFYDLEHWIDEVNACGSDEHCRADVSLDLQTGIAGRPISGNDLTPSAAQTIFNGVDPQNPIKCGAAGLSANQIQLCNIFNSAPPVAVVTPALLGSVAGGGTAGPYMTSNGPQAQASAGSDPGNLWATSVGYWMSKNPFYDATNLLTPLVASAFSGDPAKYQSVQRLIAELKGDARYYYVGKPTAGPQKKSFPDEWAYQRNMNSLTHNVLPGVFADYAKRKTFLQHRANTFGLLYSTALGAGVKSTSMGGGATRAKRTVANPLVTRPSLAGAVANHSLSARAGQFTPMTIAPTQLDTFAWGGAAPQLDPAYKYPRLLCTSPDRVRAGYSGRVGQSVDVQSHGLKAFGAADIRAAACNYINAVLDEWARKDSYQVLAGTDNTAGPTGCFADDVACDWNPIDFMLGLEDLVNNQLTNVQAAQREADYKVGKTWWNAINHPTPNFASLAQGAVAGGELTYLAAIRSTVEVAFSHVKDVPVLNAGPNPTGANSPPWASSSAVSPQRRAQDHFATFGEDRHNAELWGNDMFGVGYDYDIGWELPMEWQQDGNSWDICDFGAGAHAKLEAYAYAFGSDKFDIIEADFLAGAHDGAGTDTLVPDNAKFGADLVIAGDSLFTVAPNPIPLNGQGSTFPLAQGSNSWTIVEIPFQISFLTLTIKVGVGYSYDVNATITPTHTNACLTGQHPPAPTLGVTGVVDPEADLDGIVDADVGIGPPGLADVGLEVNIVLLGMGLPANATIALAGQGSALNLQISEGLNMDFHTLDGTLSVYADLLFFRLFDIELLSWNGLHSTVPLFNTSQTLKLADLAVIGNTGLVNPAGSLADL